jgi:two-component system nitrate/nitrite response regulator NarL
MLTREYNVYKKKGSASMILLTSSNKTLCRTWREAIAGVYPTHQASEARALIQSVQELQPTIVFLDYNDSTFRGPSLLRKIKATSPSTRLFIFTNNPTEKEALILMAAGVRGYSCTNLNGTLLKRAAHAVSNGEIWIARKFTAAIIDELSKSAGAKSAAAELQDTHSASANVFVGLSPREREIASLVAHGEHNKSISSNLKISEKTVKAHLTTIFKKLGVDGRTRLAIVVSQHRSVATGMRPLA